jgi:glycosyltransferase involved in cell wall biosynthesis
VSRPRVALVGWRLGTELEGVIRAGRDRFDYTVISMDLAEPLRGQVDWRRLPRPPLGSFRLGWALFFALGGLRLARVDADLVHCVGPLPVVPNRADLDTVTFCQAAYDQATAGRIKGSASAIGWRLGQRFTVALERWWFRRHVRVLVGISEGSAADLRRHYPGVRVAVVPRGIDLDRFAPDEDDRLRFRSEQGVPPDALVALFVDQQHRPLKGLEIAIRAFAAARDAGAAPDLLWVAGAGNDRYAPLARSLGVGERVRFLGHSAAIERVYRGADVFVLPTAYEAFCRAAHEAAACGLPVIAPPVNGIRELIGRDEAGIVAARDPAAVASALASVAGDPERRARMGVVARRRASRFDERAVTARVLALHESLVGGQNPAQPAEPAASG